MDDSKRRFIEAATRRISDNAELRASAESLLGDIVIVRENTCEEAVRR